MVNQIDSIFAKAKSNNKSTSKGKNTSSKTISKLPVQSGKTKIGSAKEMVTPKPTKAKSGSSSDPFALSSSNGKNTVDFTEEGWKIYTPEELDIGKGGDTELCPFDCNCCF